MALVWDYTVTGVDLLKTEGSQERRIVRKWKIAERKRRKEEKK